jgi:hypothetical protein
MWLLKCKYCGLEAHSSDDFKLFRPHKQSKFGYLNLCKECRNSREKTYKKPSYEKRRQYMLKHKYNITPTDYNVFYEEQQGCCAICGVHQSKLEKPLAVDHCHDTGQVRGLLCFDCNTGIGKLKDSIELLKKALQYLE